MRTLTASDVIRTAGKDIDAIVGGFPCQPWSAAGKQLGAADPRHLWPEYYRLICELRPRWVVGENVPGLLAGGADAILDDLEAQGYTTWPIVLAASDVGATHIRRRVFFIAKRDCMGNAKIKGLENNRCGTWANGQTFAGFGSDGRHLFPAPPGQRQFNWEEPRIIQVESALGGAVDGVPRRLARWRKGALKGLGNAVVPQVAELVGRIVLQADSVNLA